MPLKNPPIEKAEHIPSTRQLPALLVRRYITPHTLSPRTHLLSNGAYAVMVTNAGGGYSRRQGLAMTRWREDITPTTGAPSITYATSKPVRCGRRRIQPTRREPDEYEVTFAPDRAMFRRIDFDIEIRMEIVVSPEDDGGAAARLGHEPQPRARSLDLTSYAEVVLAPAARTWRIRHSVTCSSRRSPFPNATR